MKALVTGGAGYIGSTVANFLIDRGHDVTIIDNLSTGIKKNIPNKAIFFKTDISDSKKIKKILAKKSFDIVYATSPTRKGWSSTQQDYADCTKVRRRSPRTARGELHEATCDDIDIVSPGRSQHARWNHRARTCKRQGSLSCGGFRPRV